MAGRRLVLSVWLSFVRHRILASPLCFFVPACLALCHTVCSEYQYMRIHVRAWCDGGYARIYLCALWFDQLKNAGTLNIKYMLYVLVYMQMSNSKRLSKPALKYQQVLENDIHKKGGTESQVLKPQPIHLDVTAPWHKGRKARAITDLGQSPVVISHH